MRIDSRAFVSLQELIALRARPQHRQLLQRQKVQQHLPGDTRSSQLGPGVEFADVRAYQPGDDIRSIDWRALARSGKTATRLYSVERERQMHIIADQRAPMFFGSQVQFKSVLAARLAAAAAWSALHEGFRISGQVTGETEFRSRSSATQQAAINLIKALVEYNQNLSIRSSNTLSLAHMLSTCMANTRSGTHITLISDFSDLDAASVQSLISISRSRKLRLIAIFDPIEKTLPVSRTVGISDGRERRQINVSSRIQHARHKQFDDYVHLLKHTAATAGATLQFSSTHDTSGFAAKLTTAPPDHQASDQTRHHE